MHPRVTIKSAPKTRTGTSQRTGKEYSIRYQEATVETEEIKGPIDVPLDDDQQGYEVGAVYEWHITKDLTLGRFGVDLGRRMTLLPAVPVLGGAAVAQRKVG